MAASTSASAGGCEVRRTGLQLFAGINIGSGVTCDQVRLLREAGAELSGYVYIDGAPIRHRKIRSRRRRSAALRDGVRTADDTPLAGRRRSSCDNGNDGHADLIGEALPGSYSGAAPIRFASSPTRNGYYHFGGLRAGMYAVVEVQPERSDRQRRHAGHARWLRRRIRIGIRRPAAEPTPHSERSKH